MKDPVWSRLLLKDRPCERNPLCRTAAIGKGGSHWRSSWRTLSLGRDPALEQGESVRSPSLRSGRDNVLGTDHNPLPFSSCTTVQEKVEKTGSEVGAGKKGGVKGRWF